MIKSLNRCNLTLDLFIEWLVYLLVRYMIQL
jgi:hypothetical protein